MPINSFLASLIQVKLFIEAFWGKFCKPSLYSFSTGNEYSEIDHLFFVIHCPPLFEEYRTI